MDEQQIRKWIKTAFADQPAKHLDDLNLLLVWPDDLANQERVVDILIREAAKKRDRSEKQDRWRRSETAHNYLRSKAREAAYAIQSEGAKPEDFPPNLIAWALSIVGGEAQLRKNMSGRPPTQTLRNLIILALVEAIRDETNREVSIEAALSYIAEVTHYAVETIRSGMKKAEEDRKTGAGIWVYNAVEMMVYDTLQALGEKPL